MTYSFETLWRELRERCAALGDELVLVTPGSERPFVVVSTDDDRIVVAYHGVTVQADDRGDERVLWRNGFDVLYRRLTDDGETLTVSSSPPGVEPYVAVLSLSSRFAVDGDTIVAVAADEGATDEGETTRTGHGEADELQSTFVRPAWEVRSTPERVHDDALLLADALERYDLRSRDVESLSTDDLVNLYVLLSDVGSEADRLRRAAGEALQDRLGPDDRVHGQFGSVTRTRRSRRRVKAAEDVFAALDAEGIPREWVLGVDTDRLDVVLSVTELEESAVYDVEEQVYVQKTGVEEAEKQSRLRGLKERLADLDDEEAADLHAEIEGLEERIEEVLAPS